VIGNVVKVIDDLRLRTDPQNIVADPLINAASQPAATARELKHRRRRYAQSTRCQQVCFNFANSGKAPRRWLG
jgi:hypothetical protein